MAFCSNCGKELVDGAKFCFECGSATQPEKPSEREVVYEGKIHKCPNCGEIINSFETHCSLCNWEIRFIEATNSVRELALKLEQIESRQMPQIQEQRSFLKKVIGKDFNKKDAVDEQYRRFEKSKKDEKINLIQNFPIPNTKEDVMEFIILASSNINVKEGKDDDISKAWSLKLKQVYKKAQILFNNQDDLNQIAKIYEQKKKEILIQKIKNFISEFIWFFMLILIAVFCFIMAEIS